ncbi:MAG: hypothetical protein Q9160_004030 [Pyrenula sp. 1 TL-2023]
MAPDNRKRSFEETRAPSRSPPRKRKRPGALTTAADRVAIEKRQQERDRAPIQGTVQEISNEFYNRREEYAQTRGREWRKQESTIKGLRGFNNWVKSCIIQKFSPREKAVQQERGWGEEPVEEQADNSPLLVLDMGCGKGGDLTKWKLAPERVALYVGLDPASQSITQANTRYQEMLQQDRKQSNRFQNNYRQRRNPLFDSRILVKDCYGESIGDLPIVQEVGFDPGVGPGGNPMQSRFRPGGFDVVTMMFCMHYAFETEAKARQMLKNVAGSLKKGGRFIGVIPNSDVLSAKVEEWHRQHPADEKEDSANHKPHNKLESQDQPEAQEKPKTDEKPPSTDQVQSDPASSSKATANGEATPNGLDSPPYKLASPSPPQSEADAPPNPAPNADLNPNSLPPAAAQSQSESQQPQHQDPPSANHPSWGNTIYSVRFVTPTLPLLSPPSPQDRTITFRPPFGHKYLFYMSEAVDVPEYVVPWEAFRALAEDYNLELRWRKPFLEIWDQEMRGGGGGGVDGPGGGRGGMRDVAERMGILERGDRSGRLGISEEEREAVAFYHGFCFVRV